MQIGRSHTARFRYLCAHCSSTALGIRDRQYACQVQITFTRFQQLKNILATHLLLVDLEPAKVNLLNSLLLDTGHI